MQTSYSEKPGVAFAGMLDGVADHDIGSYLNEEASGIGFGLGVVQGTADNQFKVPAATGFSLLGVTVHSHAYDNQDLSGALGIPVKGEASVLMRGRIWVKPEVAIALGDDVFVRHTAGVGEVLGSFRNDADTADADQITNARWLTSCDAGGYALLQLNLP